MHIHDLYVLVQLQLQVIDKLVYVINVYVLHEPTSSLE